MNSEIVQYFVVNSEVKMSAGKLSVQVAHISTIITHDIVMADFKNIKTTNEIYEHVDWHLWFNNDQKKIILRGKEKDLLKLIDQGFWCIRDKGYNELPDGTLTVVGLPPMTREEAQQYIKRLQLY